MIRVLRLLEYTFENAADAEDHMGRLGVPANGTFRLPPGRPSQHGRSQGPITIRSAIVTDFDAKTKIEVTEIPRYDLPVDDGHEG